MALVYDLLMGLLENGMRLAVFFHPKAHKWVEGRKNWRARYPERFQKTAKVLWIHAASLGEFEQGRPVIEAFRERFPGWQIVLTFFSPSGYEIRQNYPFADAVLYLPADTRRNARDFLRLIQPDAAIFIKYEFWANYLRELKRASVPTLLASGLFRPGQPFFQWYGAFWRNMLRCFDHFFVQNETSAQLLRKASFSNVTAVGDTRVDRVLKLAATAPENAVLAAFTGAERGLIAGSTWPADEAVLLPALQHPDFQHLKIVIAPHEPSEKHLAQLLPRLNKPLLRYSAWGESTASDRAAAQVLVIDNVGMLNTLYRYGNIAYIGGGFGKGIHNTLEPAAFGLPVIFGPRYEKFEEARQFVARGGAFPVRDTAELTQVLIFLQEPENYRKASAAVRTYLEENRGATGRILEYLVNSGLPALPRV